MPQSKHSINKIDRLFRTPLQASEVIPPSTIWNNIEREVLLKERKEEKRKILFFRWAIAASIVFLFSLATYSWVILTENNELKQEAALINKTILPVPDPISVQPEVSEILELNAAKTNHETEKIISGHENNSAAAQTYAPPASQVRNEDPVHKEAKPEIADNIDKQSGIDKAIEVLNANTMELQAPVQAKHAVNTDTNNTDMSAHANEPKIQADSLPASFVQSNGLLSDSGSSSEKFALDDPNKIKEKTISGWWAGVFYSPDYTYQNFSVALNNTNAAYMKDSYVNASSPKYSYTTGFQAGYRINERWSVQAGILYADKGERTDYKLVDTSASPNVFTTTTITTVAEVKGLAMDESCTVNYKYRYFDVPFLVKHHRGKNRLRYCISAGFSPNFFFKHQVVTKSKDTGEKQTVTENPAPFKSVNYSAIASVGMEYNFSDRISVSLEPTFRYAFTSTVKNSIINTYPYSLGLMTGVKYHI